MKVIFLDIDGVLNSAPLRRAKLQQGDFSLTLDPQAIARLKKIVEDTQASIVLTSTWRKFWMRGGCIDSAGKKLDSTFKDFGLFITDKIPVLPEGSRSTEVAQWLKGKAYVEQFVILDDRHFGWSRKLRAHWVHCDDETGLTDPLAALAIDILRGERSASEPFQNLLAKLRKRSSGR